MTSKFNSMQLLIEDELFSKDPEEAEDNLGYVEDYITEHFEEFLISRGFSAEEIENIDIMVELDYNEGTPPYFTFNINIRRFFGDKEKENVEQLVSINEPTQIQVIENNWKKALSELDGIVIKFEDQIHAIFTAKATDWQSI